MKGKQFIFSFPYILKKCSVRIGGVAVKALVKMAGVQSSAAVIYLVAFFGEATRRMLIVVSATLLSFVPIKCMNQRNSSLKLLITEGVAKQRNGSHYCY